MKVAFATDHAAADARSGVLDELKRQGHEVVDFGAGGENRVDYPDYAARALEAYQRGEVERVVLMCGTGLGMSYVANRMPGVRCALCTDEYAATMSRSHNDANCLALRAREQDPELNRRILRLWFETPFEGGRHRQRLEKIEEYGKRFQKPAR